MKFIRPGIRRYKVENLYEQLREREEMEKEVEALEAKQRKWKAARSGYSESKKPEGKQRIDRWKVHRAYAYGKVETAEAEENFSRG